MVITMTNSEKELERILESPYDAIVVEGYDGVGKGRLLNQLSEKLGAKPYRPDYNLWQSFDHRIKDRWKVSGFFWDVFTHFGIECNKPLLFDRGIFSGAAYNNDPLIAAKHNEITRGANICYILVKCSKENYEKMCLARNPRMSKTDIMYEWDRCQYITSKYEEAFEIADIDYIIYINEFNEELSSDTCESCGHHNHGWCRHPAINLKVDKDSPRCEYSYDKEVQDTL